MKTWRWMLVFVMCAVLMLGLSGLLSQAEAPITPAKPVSTPAKDFEAGLLEELNAVTSGTIQMAQHFYIGKVRFIGLGRPIPASNFMPRGPKPDQVNPETAARAFLSVYGRLFGLRDQAQELTVMRAQPDDVGYTFVRFQQVHRGVPILGGELIVQVNDQGDVFAATGEILPDLALNTTPTISAAQAREKALTTVAKDYELPVEQLTATEPELWIYNPLILGGPGPRRNALVWRTDVTADAETPLRQLVLIDARLGSVALTFNQVATARDRRIYDNQNNTSYGLPGNGPVRVEGGAATGIAQVDKAYDYSGDTYDFYQSYHGRDSLNNAGMPMIITVRYCRTGYSCPYANAFWNGTQMVFGDGYVTDDIMAHELTHGVTEFSSHLFYYYQSGAINEAFSDIWGEFVDLTNGRGNDAAAVRWLMGEEAPGGAIRSMSNPPAYNDPDKMTSSYYTCDLNEQDNGGVHTNSGVANKAAYLMTDGGSFNGKTVTGLGITKTAKIWYKVQTNLLTSASDYADLHTALQQSCNSLIGTAGITASDCTQVLNAADATEMHLQPTSCAANHAPICAAGQTPVNIFFDNLESTGSGNWTSSAAIGTNRWYYPQNSNPYGFDATYATSGQYNFWGYNQSTISDFNIRMTRNVALPAGSQPYLHFNHAYGFEDSASNTVAYDGGVVEYSTDNGTSWTDAGSLFTHNGYNRTINSSSNPLHGRSAFGSESNGYYSSRLNLASLAGQNVRFRFRIGTDSSKDDWGWFIDDIRIYTCASGATATPTATATGTATRPSTPTPTVTVGSPTVIPTVTATRGRVNRISRTVYAVADAMTLSGYPTTNFGATADMWAGFDDRLNPDGGIARAMVKFNMPSLPAGSTVTNARLRLYYMGFWDVVGNPNTLTASRITTPWNEGAVTWNTRPGVGWTYSSIEILANEAWGWREFNVTELVKAWAADTLPNYGIIIRGPETPGPTSSWRAFSTREGDYPPQLIITYSLPAGSSGEVPPEDEIIVEPGEGGPALLDTADRSEDSGTSAGRILRHQ